MRIETAPSHRDWVLEFYTDDGKIQQLGVMLKLARRSTVNAVTF